MAPDTDALERLHDHLVQVLGPGDAGTLMAVVTAVDTTNLATKDDLALLRAEMETIKHELIGAFRGELVTAVTSLNRNLVFSVIGAVVATATAVITAAQVG